MRSLILGDFHLHPSSSPRLVDDFRALVLGFEEPVRVVLSGDIYDLAAMGDGPLAERFAAIDRRHGAFHDALCEVVARGGEVVLVAGNHDLEMAGQAGAALFTARVPGAQVAPWFYRVDDVVHVEHGSQYDPDNVRPQPLEAPHDPLGVLLTRKLLAPLGDLRLLELGDSTPLPMLVHCFTKYGRRAPGLVLRYVWLGLRLCLADPARHRREARAGDGDLAALAARSTLASRGEVFRRMYLDRIALSVTLFAVFAGERAGWWLVGSPAWTGIGAASLGLVLAMPNRYRGRVEDRLRAAAHQATRITDSRQVVFGHAHHAYDDGVYLNTGAYGFAGKGRRRTYVEVKGGRARLCTQRAGEF